MAAPVLYLITDRRGLGPDPLASRRLVDLIGDASRAGVDMIQIREKDLPARALFALAREAVTAAEDGARVFVNERFDVALAARAHGVHLTANSVTPRTAREAVGRKLKIGVSTHSGSEVLLAGRRGADFAVCGPAFATPSKQGLGTPLGLRELDQIAARAAIPVIALGGIQADNVRDVLATRVAGIAAIRLFQDAWLRDGYAGLRSLVERTKG